RLQLIAGIPQPAAKVHHQGLGDGGASGVKLPQSGAVEGAGNDGGERHRVGTSRAAVERGNLAKHVSGNRVPEAQLASLVRHDSQTDAPLCDEKEPASRFAAAKQHFALGKSNLATGCRASRQVGTVQAAEKLRLSQ